MLLLPLPRLRQRSRRTASASNASTTPATNVLRAKDVYACTLVGRDGLARTVLYDPTLVGR